MIFTALQSGAFEAAEKLINRALQYDPATLRKIAQLEGKLLLIESNLPPLRLALETTRHGIMLHSNWRDEADTTVSGSLVSILAMAVSKEPQISFAGTGISVTGDLEFLRQINVLMGELDVDWEAALATLVGDIPAHLMAESLRKSATLAADVGQRAKSAAAEIAQEELRLNPTANEFADFSQQVREFSSGVERSAARVNKLRHQLSELVARQNPHAEPKL